jgi:hypothetical protein
MELLAMRQKCARIVPKSLRAGGAPMGPLAAAKFQKVRPPPNFKKKPLKPDGRGMTSARRASTAKYVVANVHFWGTADIGGFWPGTVCPLLPQSGHQVT